MGAEKKKVRQRFREAVFARDGYKCRMCGWKQDPAQLDAHHITDRNELLNGGYVKENGISLCPPCHVKAEEFHSTGTAAAGYASRGSL
jgi:rubredoxin